MQDPFFIPKGFAILLEERYRKTAFKYTIEAGEAEARGVRVLGQLASKEIILWFQQVTNEPGQLCNTACRGGSDHC